MDIQGKRDEEKLVLLREGGSFVGNQTKPLDYRQRGKQLPQKKFQAGGESLRGGRQTPSISGEDADGVFPTLVIKQPLEKSRIVTT